jgi:hypothetical protein
VRREKKGEKGGEVGEETLDWKKSLRGERSVAETGNEMAAGRVASA